MWWKILIAALALAALWDLAWPLAGVPQTPPWQLPRQVESGSDPVILDVRTPAEFAWFHAPGAINRPFPLDSETLDIPKDQEIVVACMTGHRSPIAAWQLKRAGYAKVSNLTWGMLGYRLLGGAVSK